MDGETPKPLYNSFYAYEGDYPEGQNYRAWLISDKAEDLILVHGDSPHGGLPGGYIWVRRTNAVTINRRKRPTPYHHPAMIACGDNDDGLVTREFESDDAARECFEIIRGLAPFNMSDLVDLLDFQY